MKPATGDRMPAGSGPSAALPIPWEDRPVGSSHGYLPEILDFVKDRS